MGTDSDTTLREIKQMVSQFVEERDWLQYHDPKNLVMALMSEVGELADQFRWVKNTESHALAASPDHAEEVADELADIMMFAIEFASVCNIDISAAIVRSKPHSWCTLPSSSESIVSKSETIWRTPKIPSRHRAASSTLHSKSICFSRVVRIIKCMNKSYLYVLSISGWALRLGDNFFPT